MAILGLEVKFKTGTQAQYDALSQKDANTFYAIVSENGALLRAYLGEIRLDNEGIIEAAVAQAVTTTIQTLRDSGIIIDCGGAPNE